MKNDTKIDTRGSPKTRKAALEAAFAKFNCDPVGTRTQDPYIKSVLLYQLSYEINRVVLSNGTQR
jgi:hypothetical protein